MGPDAAGDEPAPLFRDRARASSFGANAELYDRSRPRYPDALIDDLVVEHPPRVLDVGCGTGLLGRSFVERGHPGAGRRARRPDGRGRAPSRPRGRGRHVRGLGPTRAALRHCSSQARRGTGSTPSSGRARLPRRSPPAGRWCSSGTSARSTSGSARASNAVYDELAARPGPPAHLAPSRPERPADALGGRPRRHRRVRSLELRRVSLRPALHDRGVARPSSRRTATMRSWRPTSARGCSRPSGASSTTRAAGCACTTRARSRASRGPRVSRCPGRAPPRRCRGPSW